MATKSLADEVEALCQMHHATILHKKPQLGCKVCDGIADLARRVGEMATQLLANKCPSGCGKSRDWLHCDDVWHLSKPPPEPAND